MDIYHALFWACAALCAVAELSILRAVFRPAPGLLSAADPGPTTDVPRSPQGIEIIWGVLPLFALVAIFWAAWQALA